jgi:CheY-like chemotaxis protein
MYMRLINTAARDASAVVRRLRELYAERGEPLTATAVDLKSCIEHAVALTQPRWRNQALANGATIQVNVDVTDAPMVAGDSADIREVLTNLIFNAVDAMPGGGSITISARRQDDYARVEVRDTGSGMSEEVQRRCLEPFFSTKGQHGTGLGLVMVNALIERHRGSCTIESQVGVGTTFILRLPVYALAGAAATAATAAMDRSRRLRILVVEDEANVRRVITEQLTADGHTVDSATNGAEGLQKFQAGWFDLVVTDRAMPEMGGDQFAAALHQIAPEKPVIMLTGFGDLMTAKGERPAGVDVVVSKPVTQDQLRSALIEATSSR